LNLVPAARLVGTVSPVAAEADLTFDLSVAAP
jgi:hypothetical protein